MAAGDRPAAALCRWVLVLVVVGELPVPVGELPVPLKLLQWLLLLLLLRLVRLLLWLLLLPLLRLVRLLLWLFLLPLLRLLLVVLFCCSLSCWPACGQDPPWQGQPRTMGWTATSAQGQPWLFLVLGLLLLLLLLWLLLLPLMRLVRLATPSMLLSRNLHATE